MKNTVILASTLDAEQVRTAIRTDLGPIALGSLFTATGLASLISYRMRRKTKDPALIWFGLFAFLYGVRLLAKCNIVQFASGIPYTFWHYAISALTYVVPIPSTLYLYEVFPRWRLALKRIAIVQGALAASGIAADQFFGRPQSLGIANNSLVIVLTVTFVVVLFRHRAMPSEAGPLRIGLLAFCSSIIAANVTSFSGGPAVDFEPIGFAFFLVSLGIVLGKRAMRNQERLAALDQELEIARRIQASILPREMPRTAVSIAARYLPMTAVAGDFYDFLVIDESRIGILVADVSGHGVPAALIASMVKVAIAAQLPHADDPARVLTGMNQTLSGNLQGQFVTAAYLFLDAKARRMRYAAAGHPPLLWFHRDEQRVEAITENGLLLGLMPAATYSYTERQFDDGDRFFLYTDGITEATNANGEFFGDERLQEQVSKTAGDAEDSVASLLRALANWAGHDRGRAQDDDLTVVIAEIAATATAQA